jgi:hypothetical protein
VKTRRRTVSALAWITIVSAAALPGFAQDAAIEFVGSHGYIDWIDQRVVAAGTGVPRLDVGPPKARVLAERAALIDARRNLLEVIQGVHIDAETTVGRLMTPKTAITHRVEGVIRFSVIDSIQHLEDGTVRTTVSMPLPGRLATAFAPLPVSPPKAGKATAAPGVPTRGPSGLIIDARGIGFLPCWKPQIYLNDELLYPGPNVDRQQAARFGFVRYVRDAAPKAPDPRVGDRPLRVRAAATNSGNRGLTIDPKDGDLLNSVTARPDNFLAECRVMIVF